MSDTIRFTLVLADSRTASDARMRYARLVRDFLFQAGIEGDALIPAIEQGISARGTLAGTPYAITPFEPDDEAGIPELTVTFFRTSQTQGN